MRGEPNPDVRRFERVAAATTPSIDAILGTRSSQDRTELLRRMRDDGAACRSRQGRPAHPPNQGSEPPAPAESMRAYVFAASHVDYVRVAAEQIKRDGR